MGCQQDEIFFGFLRCSSQACSQIVFILAKKSVINEMENIRTMIIQNKLTPS